MAKNPDVQERLREEIEEITNGDLEKDLTYEKLQSMSYLDQVISETLRHHNPLGVIQRITAKDYLVPGTNLKLTKNTQVWINTKAIHFDPKHYPDPHVFNPDHFSKEAKAQRNP